MHEIQWDYSFPGHHTESEGSRRIILKRTLEKWIVKMEGG
jgi:hypothetical protein